MLNPIHSKEINKIASEQPNLWYAFFAITGLDKSITKLFSYTPEQININPVKDSKNGS